MTETDDVPEIKRALQMFRAARAATLKAFEHECPDLYRLSVVVFCYPLGSLPHKERLGEFLTEWDNELGRSPLECLTQGRIIAVRQALAGRAGLDVP